MRNVQPLRMLPRHHSNVTSFSDTHLTSLVSSNSLHSWSLDEHPVDESDLLCQTVSFPQLSKYPSTSRRRRYDENQSAEAGIETDLPFRVASEEVKEATAVSSRAAIKPPGRAYDRSGRKCWPNIQSNLTKVDLEYAYEIMGDTLQSYIRYRKLNQCSALENFLDYRNKVYQREKLAQYAPASTQPIGSTETTVISREKKPENMNPPVPLITVSTASAENNVPSKVGAPLKKAAEFIPIPSPELLPNNRKKAPAKVNPPKTVGPSKQIKVKQTMSPSGKVRPDIKQAQTKETHPAPNKEKNGSKQKKASCTIV